MIVHRDRMLLWMLKAMLSALFGVQAGVPDDVSLEGHLPWNFALNPWQKQPLPSFDALGS